MFSTQTQLSHRLITNVLNVRIAGTFDSMRRYEHDVLREPQIHINY